MKKAAIILPTYNEGKNIEKVIEQLFAVAAGIPNWGIHVVVVDSSSPDGTGQIVEEMRKRKNKYRDLHVLHTKKEGLGKAYTHGFTYAIEKIKPFVLFEMDSDLSHNPQDIPLFLKKIEEGADFVVGSRYIPGGSIPSNWPLQRKILSTTANLFIRLGFMKLRITDWTNGYRAIKTWVVQKSLKNIEGHTGYVFQIALLDNALKNSAIIREIPNKFIDRTEGESKINSGQYITDIIFYILQNSSFIKFCIVGGSGFIVDFGFAYTFIHTFNLPKVVSNMLSAEIAIISNFFLNNYWSFAHKKIGERTSLLKSVLKFNLVSSGSILIQGVGMWLALTLLGDHVFRVGNMESHTWIIYKIGIILLIVIPYSYFFYNRFVWKEK
ncbi:glycosyltransferase family 2 protein [Candidatus Woesebacteria bacterium]|nr:glycosyltransferase family 2 protein [Candidatus Woesebacteria bacterium]